MKFAVTMAVVATALAAPATDPVAAAGALLQRVLARHSQFSLELLWRHHRCRSTPPRGRSCCASCPRTSNGVGVNGSTT